MTNDIAKRTVLGVLIALAFLWGVSRALAIESNVVEKGEHLEVSTIVGNGTQGQGDYTVDHPRFPVSDGEGNVYFIDGSQKTAKLRMWDGKKNKTIVDLRKNKVTGREGEFFSTGVAVAGKTVYFSSEEKAYKMIEERVTEVTDISKWMKENKFQYIYRMESAKDDLIFMLWRKDDRYAFIRYTPEDRNIEELLPARRYGEPLNFELLPEGILISVRGGFLYYEQFFPRKSHTTVDTNEGTITDAWADEDKNIYYSLVKDKVRPTIRIIPQGKKAYNETEDIVGSIAGFVDGIADEVQMDNPMDFSWDGSGYLFSDRESNAIRKLWIDKKPLYLVH